MSQKQKDAVYSAITAVLNETGVTVSDNDSFSEHLTREHRAQVTNILVEGFTKGEIALDKDITDAAELRTYCSSLISNWLRKDPRLNGGSKYEAKNPGSRVGSSDPSLQAMRILLKTKSDAAERAEIQAFIDERVGEIRSTRKPTAQVDFAVLPAGLQKYKAQ